MQKLSEITPIKQPLGIIRHKYMPYKDEVSVKVWYEIAKEIIPKVIVSDQIGVIWRQLIKYIHGDESFKGELNKAIYLCGVTGSGKSKTIDMMNRYIGIDKVVYFKNGKNLPFSFAIVNSREISEAFSKSGHDGLSRFKLIGNLCIDDLGAEPKTANYFGNKLDVLSELIEYRYSNNLLTHYTSNLHEDDIEGRYNSRVSSRIVGTCNIIEFEDVDYRLNK
jgi:DNA replication protein DnaC